MFSRVVSSLIFLNLWLLSFEVLADRFLFISTNVAFSHIAFNGRLADILIDAGHEVDFVIPLFNNFVNINGTKKANVTRVHLDITDDLERRILKLEWWNNVFESKGSPHEPEKFKSMFADYCESMLSKSDFLDHLRSRNYTIGMAETIDPCSFSLFHLLGIKVTHELSALPLMEHTQVNHGISLDPNIPLTFNHEQITPIESLFERARNWFMYLSFRWGLLEEHPVNKLMKRMIASDFPTSEELMGRADFVWLNTNKFIDFPRSLPAKVKQIGGVGVDQPQELDEILKSIFERASKGVILVSFGSIVNTTHMKTAIRDAFLDAFAQFPDYEFIWKVTDVNGNNLSRLASTRYPNVHLVNWMNQPSILSRSVAFISHLGLNSLNEAAQFGVPMIAIPFFADQQFNTAVMLKRKLGVYLNRRQITTKTLSDAIRTVLENPVYRNAAKELSRKITDVPFTPREVFIRSVEFSSRQGPLNEWQLPAAKINFIQQNSLDLLALAITTLFAFLYTTFVVSRRAIRLMSLWIGRTSEQQKKNL
ncbi:UDP-glucuronosyltransferase [Aphelenchoides besseyi]|nr:UDP-glucuronosyltransferase [Aphelenchoides besseyi]